MRVVVDTNVLVSGTYFGGKPGKVVDAIADGQIQASASSAIVAEYSDTIEEVARKGFGHFDARRFSHFIEKLNLIEPFREVKACRDPDDDKFISCAVDSNALYIVSGDKDLLCLGAFEGVEIITAAQFCERYLL